MTDHDPKAVDSLAAILDGEHVMQGFELGFVESAENRRIGSAQLDALADSGLAVVRVGEVPPWMEQVQVPCPCAEHRPGLRVNTAMCPNRDGWTTVYILRGES